MFLPSSLANAAVDNDVVRPFQMPASTWMLPENRRPAPEPAAHRRLGDTIGKRGAAGKVERPAEKICHGFSIWLGITANLRSAIFSKTTSARLSPMSLRR
jgi:hypothetical protein